MASMTRTIARRIAFAGMNKQQRLMWAAQHGGKNKQSVREKCEKHGIKVK